MQGRNIINSSCCIAKIIPAAILALVINFCFSPLVYGEDLFKDMGVIMPKFRGDAPYFILKDIGGNTRSIDEFRGKVLLIHFWSTRCFSCKHEMPHIEIIWNKFKDKGLAVVSVSVDKKGLDRVRKFCKDKGITFPVLLDTEGEVRKEYEITALPTSYLIGRDGKFIGKVIGSREWTSDKAILFINSLVTEQ